jgi:hypothetical protein
MDTSIFRILHKELREAKPHATWDRTGMWFCFLPHGNLSRPLGVGYSCLQALEDWDAKVQREIRRMAGFE